MPCKNSSLLRQHMFIASVRVTTAFVSRRSLENLLQYLTEPAWLFGVVTNETRFFSSGSRLPAVSPNPAYMILIFVVIMFDIRFVLIMFSFIGKCPASSA